MSQLPETSPTTKQNPWQFSLAGMLLFTVSVAIGAAVAKGFVQFWFQYNSPEAKNDAICFSGGLITILLFWMLVGISYQVRDLRLALALRSGLTYENRWGLRFEVFWRIAISMLIVLYVLLSFLKDRGILKFSSWEDGLIFSAGMLPKASAVMLLLVIVGAVPFVRRKQHKTLLHRLLLLIAWLLAGYFCIFRFMDDTTINSLVHIAINGIENAQPLKYSAINPQTYNFYASLFFWGSLISGMIACLNCSFLRNIAKQWSLSRKWIWIWGVLIIFGVVTVIGYLIWLLNFGLKELSSCEFETGGNAPLHCWSAFCILMIVLITAITYRMVSENSLIDSESRTGWRQNSQKYFNEWRLVLLLFAVSIVWIRYEIVFISYKHPAIEGAFPFFWDQIFLDPWFVIPSDILLLALVLLSLHRAFARREKPEILQMQLPSINPVKFITVWIATAAVIVSGSVAMAWMSFALWFNPWFRGRWF